MVQTTIATQRLNTPLEVPLYRNQFFLPSDSLRLAGFTNGEELFQIVEELASKVNQTEIAMKDKESECNSKIQVVRRHYEVEIDKLTGELNQKSTLIDELEENLDDNETDLQITIWDRNSIKGELKAAERKLQEEVDKNKLMVERFHKLLADEKGAKENLADQLNSANIELKNSRFKISPQQARLNTL